MADDLVGRLREYESCLLRFRDKELVKEAADALERLQDELKETRQTVWDLQNEQCARDGVPMPSQRPLVDKQREEIERLRSAAINLNAAVDAMWNDIYRYSTTSRDRHERAICAAQQDLQAALSSTTTERNNITHRRVTE